MMWIPYQGLMFLLYPAMNLYDRIVDRINEMYETDED